MSEPDRPRLVFAARRAPYPLDHGAAIRTYQLLTGLARSFDTMLVTLAHHPASPDGLSRPDELVQLLPDVEVVMARGAEPESGQATARSLLRRDSWTWGRSRTPVLASALASAVATHRPDLVHFDDLGVAAWPIRGGVERVLRARRGAHDPSPRSPGR